MWGLPYVTFEFSKMGDESGEVALLTTSMRVHTNVYSKIVSALIFVAICVISSMAFPSPTWAVSPTNGPTEGGTEVDVTGIHFVQIDAGGAFALALTNTGSVFSWGSNSSGQLGIGTTSSSFVPVQVLDPSGTGYLTDIRFVAAGSSSAFAITNSGMVYAWGWNASGELGDGTTSNRLLPTRVLGLGGSGFLENIKSISSGKLINMTGTHTLALTYSGEVYSWGHNDEGELGNGSLQTSLVALSVKDITGNGFLNNVESISAGADHSLALLNDGTALAWGSGFGGKLGNNTQSNSALPVEVLNSAGSAPLTHISQLVAGGNHSAALLEDGTVSSWGVNFSGQLGDGTTVHKLLPVQVLGVSGQGVLGGVTHLAVGRYHNHAITADNTVVGWGYNADGEVGDGTVTQANFPVRVAGPVNSGPYLQGVTQITAGGYASYALTSGQSMLSWGTNWVGALGDGTNVSQRTYPGLGVNLQPESLTFGGIVGDQLTTSGNVWRVKSPPHSVGEVQLVGTVRIFGGLVPGAPAQVSWNAGVFNYQALLAKTSAPKHLETVYVSTAAVILGIGLLVALRRQNRK